MRAPARGQGPGTGLVGSHVNSAEEASQDLHIRLRRGLVLDTGRADASSWAQVRLGQLDRSNSREMKLFVGNCVLDAFWPWPSQFRTEVSVRAKSRATCPIDLSPSWQRSTTSCLNSAVNLRRGERCVVSMRTSFQGVNPTWWMSVKPGQAHYRVFARIGWREWEPVEVLSRIVSHGLLRNERSVDKESQP